MNLSELRATQGGEFAVLVDEEVDSVHADEMRAHRVASTLDGYYPDRTVRVREV